MDILGGILLFVCAICLIGGVIAYFIKKPTTPVINEVHLTIPTDSLGVFSPADREAVDSLASVVRQLDTNVNDRYNYFLEQKENEIKLVTFGGLLVSIILAILGFFGYRSFKSIEDKAVQNAEDHVVGRLTQMRNNLNDALLAEIDNRFNDEYQTTFAENVRKELKQQYDETINKRLNDIDSKAGVIESIQEKQTTFDIVVSRLYDSGVLKEPIVDAQAGDINEFSKERNAKRHNSGTVPQQPSTDDEKAENDKKEGKKGGK